MGFGDVRGGTGVEKPSRVFTLVCPTVRVRTNIETFVKDHETGRLAVQWCLASKESGEGERHDVVACDALARGSGGGDRREGGDFHTRVLLHGRFLSLDQGLYRNYATVRPNTKIHGPFRSL